MALQGKLSPSVSCFLIVNDWEKVMRTEKDGNPNRLGFDSNQAHLYIDLMPGGLGDAVFGFKL